MGETFLDKVYGARDADETRALYDDWAASYDAEVSDNGYVTPRRCAEALFSQLSEPSAPILDVGCGTGLSGLALRAAGYEVIDGMDPSAEMLGRAREKAGYRTLTQIKAGAPLPAKPGQYRAVTAIGVIGPGAAPIELFDALMAVVGRGDMLAFSLNDHALAERHYEGKLNEWLDCGAARLLVREYGDHLPGQNIKSNVYVIQRA